MKTIITTALLTTIALTGCASRPANIKPAHVDSSRFEKYDCDVLAVRIKRLDAFVAQQYATLNKDANLDALQVGTAIINPASLLFLDGTYGHKTAERGFARLEGKAAAMRRTAAKKGCSNAEQYLKEADLIDDNQYHFGTADFDKPVTTGPTDEQEDTKNE